MTTTEQRLTSEVDTKMKHAGEWVFTRLPRPDHPPFRSAERAANLLLDFIGPGARILCMRDQCLRPVRELALERGLDLIVPSKDGNMVYKLPLGAIYDSATRKRTPLVIEPLPTGSRRYVGVVDAVVVGCLGFSERERQLYSYDTDRTASILECMYEGLANGFRLNPDTPVLCIAADCQEVAAWPVEAQSYVRASAVITPSRTILLNH